MLNQFESYLSFENIYLWANFGVLPFWIMLILFPQSKITHFFVNSIILPLLLSTAYIFVLYKSYLNSYDFDGTYPAFLYNMRCSTKITGLLSLILEIKIPLAS